MANNSITQFELFHSRDQAWQAKIDDKMVPCLGIALIDGQLQGLVSPTQVADLKQQNQGWVPANTLSGFTGYYQPTDYANTSQAGQAMREPVSSSRVT